MAKHCFSSQALTPGKIMSTVLATVTTYGAVLLCVAILASPRSACGIQDSLADLQEKMRNAQRDFRCRGRGAKPQEPKPQEPQAVDEPQLVEQATWRLGEFGDLTKANGFYRLAYSPDGKLLATRTSNNIVAVYEVHSKELLCEIGGHEDKIASLSFSPDAKTLMTAAAGNGESIKVWDPATGKLLRKIKAETIHAVFSESGNRIFALTNSNVLKFDAKTGEQLGKTNYRNGSYRAKAVSNDGRYVVVSHRTNNQQAVISKRLDLESDSSVILPGPPKSMNSVAFSKDLRWLAATFHDDPDVRLWSMANPNDNKFTLKGHKDRAQSIAFSPDNRFLVSTSWDHTSIVWDLLSRESLGALKGHTEHVNSSAFAPNSLFLVTGASGKTDSSAIVWNLEKTFFPENAKTLTPDDFQATWNSLGSTVVRRALNAVNDLRKAPGKEVLEFVHSKMELESSSQSSKEIEGWIKQLDSPDFKVRESASKSLISSLVKSESLLRQTLETDCSAETRFRIRRILGHEVEKPIIDIAEIRRLNRAVFLLELIAADTQHEQQATELLQHIAKGHRSQLISRDATAAIERIQFIQAKPQK